MEPIRNICSQRGWSTRAEAVTVPTQWEVMRFMVPLGGGAAGSCQGEGTDSPGLLGCLFVLFSNLNLSSVGL